jgi:hypothetical protein
MNIVQMDFPKNLLIQVKKQDTCWVLVPELYEDCVRPVFSLHCPVLGLSEYLLQPLLSTPTILPTAQDQCLLTLKGDANV